MTEAEKRFRIIDQNDDGEVHRFEFRLNSIRLLGRIDANDDGFVTPEESLLAPEQFGRLDSDQDGKISYMEFTRAFATFDTAQAGFITFEQYLTYIEPAAN